MTLTQTAELKTPHDHHITEITGSPLDAERTISETTLYGGRAIGDPSTATIRGNVARWDSNDRVPPSDVIDRWRVMGLIGPGIVAASTAARDAETAESIAAYQAMRAEHGYSAEERAEMAAAFGEDADVVDVLTGEHIDLT